MEAVALGDDHAVEGDQPVLHDAQGDLVVKVFDAHTVRAALDDEPFDLVVLFVAGPDDDEVGKAGVADPLLLAVEDPVVTVAASRRGETSRGARSDVGLGQPERADLFEAGHAR